jgi:multidrug efflux pump subunit AcrB
VSRIIEWFARNHVAANVLMALLVVGGLSTLPVIKREVFPEIQLPVVSVSVDYPGASPKQVEEGICVRIEEAVQGLQGLKSMGSTASEGHCSVSLELMAGEDVGRRMDQIESQVGSIDNFPEEARRPIIRQAEVRFAILDVAISGDVDEWTLKRLGERARDDIAGLPGITDVELVAARPYEISIEVSEDNLRRFGITFDEVAAAVRRSSLDLAGGSLNTQGGEILLRTIGQAYRGNEFEELVILSRPDGTRLKLGDVASVVDGFEEAEKQARFDGRPAVIVQVFRVGNQSALEISSQVREYIATQSKGLPQGVSFTVTQDDSRFLRERLDTLLRNAWSGFLLVLLVLALFLRLRLALWVSLGVPLSFLGALWMLPTMDVSINLISLMAFIVVLGIVVDDAIIVGENVHTQQREAGSAMEGAIRGAIGVSTPVIFGVLTTIAAFAPMLFVPGPMGRIARVLPLVVCVCLTFSLIESLCVLPSHLAHGNGERTPTHWLSIRWHRFQDGIARGLMRFIDDRYRPLLALALEWRYLTIAAGVAMMMATAGTLGGGWIRFVFQPDVEGDVMVAYVGMPLGTPDSITQAAVDQLADAARSVQADVRSSDDDARAGDAGDAPHDVFAHVLTTVGQQPYRLKQATGPSAFAQAQSTGSHLGEVQIEVVGSDYRDVSVAELARRWRIAAGSIVGAEELSFTSTIMSAGAPLQIELAGGDLEQLRLASEWVKERIAVYPGVIDMSDSFRGGKQEIELEILPRAQALGLSLQDLGRQVRQAFYGQEVQRIQRGRDDVRVMVRYPASERESLADLQNMRIRSADGSAIPFGAVAKATIGEGFASIRRQDRRRIVSVTAEVDDSVGNANEIVADLKAETLSNFGSLFPAVAISFAGEQREQAEFLDSLARGWIIALLVIYALLAIPLRSYSQPLIIMFAIPFGLVGAVWGHLIMGHDFSMFSLVGLVALSGVVVNDSLVLIDCVNNRRRLGLTLRDALLQAGHLRFRAILLTSLTTFAGLTPLMLETSVQARMLIPMAISLAFGVIVATAITLILVPAAYLVLQDIEHAVFGKPQEGKQRETTAVGKPLPDTSRVDTQSLT